MKTILLLLLFTFSGFAQRLHHQMISSIGSSSRTSSGATVRQTVGQQSAIGNFKNANVMVGQGFQQSGKSKSVIQNNIVITTIAFPNPFIDKVNFKFSSPVEGPIKVLIFDVMGRLVHSDEKTLINNTITIDNLFFPEGEYFAKLTANSFTSSTNLLKIK